MNNYLFFSYLLRGPQKPSDYIEFQNGKDGDKKK